MKDYYKVLGVSPKASESEIRSAYRKLARQYHPDVSKEANAEERFKEIGEAYETLKDKEKRAEYDQYKAMGGKPGFGNTGGQFNGDFSDLFGSFFNGGAQRPQTGQAIEANLEIDLQMAISGGKRRFSLATTEGQKSLQVTIKPGTLDGQKIRLSGQGRAGIMGGKAGDLILIIQIKQDPRFELKGRDLAYRLPIAPWEAALGAKIKVETYRGAIEIKIPAGSRSGQKLRLKGKGMPTIPEGDLLLELMIQTPKAETEEIAQLYQSLQEISQFNPR